MFWKKNCDGVHQFLFEIEEGYQDSSAKTLIFN